MNPVAIVHFLAALVIIGISIPLICRKVKMNEAYGVRIAESFESDAAWFDINHYGGRLLLFWGIGFALTAIVGSFFSRPHWLTYDYLSLAPVLGGLFLVLVKIRRYAKRRNTS